MAISYHRGAGTAMFSVPSDTFTIQNSTDPEGLPLLIANPQAALLLSMTGKRSPAACVNRSR